MSLQAKLICQSVCSSPHIVLLFLLLLVKSKLCCSFYTVYRCYVHICVQHMLPPSSSCCIAQSWLLIGLTACAVVAFSCQNLCPR